MKGEELQPDMVKGPTAGMKVQSRADGEAILTLLLESPEFCSFQDWRTPLSQVAASD